MIKGRPPRDVLFIEKIQICRFDGFAYISHLGPPGPKFIENFVVNTSI